MRKRFLCLLALGLVSLAAALVSGLGVPCAGNKGGWFGEGALAALASFEPARTGARDPKNPLFEELINVGLPIPEGPTVKLPPPLLKPGQPLPGDLSEVLEKAAGRVPVELFLRRSVTAPFALKISSVEKGTDERCGQLVSLSFVVYGKLEALGETDYIKQLLTGKDRPGNQTTVLSQKELSTRGVQLLNSPKLKEQLGTLSLTLLDKVQIDGVTRTIEVKLPHAIVSATRLDERFNNDKEYPNRWRSVKRLVDEDQDRLGPPHPYSGLGGYVVVTELPEPKGALLLEMQYLLHEPPDWFGGPNLLRSKLPIAIQDNVRSFRRKLARE